MAATGCRRHAKNRVRRRSGWLRRLLAVAEPPLALMPATRELVGAQAWMREHAAAGGGGRGDQIPRARLPARRRSWKVRTQVTADAVVSGVIGSFEAPEALLLGLPDGEGRFADGGADRTADAACTPRAGCAAVPPGAAAHPWPQRLPTSRLGALPGDLIDYTPTEPLLVVEVDTDSCFEQQRWRHPTGFRRVRDDLQPGDLTGPE